jgi:hypothetical protein
MSLEAFLAAVAERTPAPGGGAAAAAGCALGAALAEMAARFAGLDAEAGRAAGLRAEALALGEIDLEGAPGDLRLARARGAVARATG